MTIDIPTVIKHLHNEAARDSNRSADALSVTRDMQAAIVFSVSSIICNRIAMALEAGSVAALAGTTAEWSDDAEEPPAKKKRKKRSDQRRTTNAP